MSTHGSIWYSLDVAAAANVPAHMLAEYMRYRNELRDEGMTWEEAEPILRGFIWSEIEASNEPEQSDE